MSNEKQPTKKANVSETIKKYFNYPMLLLAVISLCKLKGIFANFVSIFTTLFNAPASILRALISLVLTTLPLAVLFLLWLRRNKNYEKSKIIIAVIFAIASFIKIYNLFINLKNPYFFSNSDFVLTGLPYLLSSIFAILLYFLLAIDLFLNRKKHMAFYIVAILYIIETLFFAIAVSLIASGSIFSYFLSTLEIIAFWYIPKALENSEAAEITKGKGKGLIAILCVTLVMYVICGISTGSFSSNSSTGNDYWDYYDYDKDGEINQGEWEDALGDYMDDIMGQ